MTEDVFIEFLEPFEEYPALRERVRTVLERLPEPVVEDFVQDESFHVALENFVPGQGTTLLMAMPGPNRSASRAVVLRKRLNDCNEDFALYVIAHELAHAHLHNGGWRGHSDPEVAADALAESWGFPKVSRPATF